MRLQQRDLRQQRFALHGVAAHDGEFLVAQLAGLVQYLIRHGDLADVVQDRSQRDFLDLSGAVAPSQRRFAEKMRSDVVDAANVVAAFPAAKFDGRCQRFDHAFVEGDDRLRDAQRIGAAAATSGQCARHAHFCRRR